MIAYRLPAHPLFARLTKLCHFPESSPLYSRHCLPNSSARSLAEARSPITNLSSFPASRHHPLATLRRKWPWVPSFLSSPLSGERLARPATASRQGTARFVTCCCWSPPLPLRSNPVFCLRWTPPIRHACGFLNRAFPNALCSLLFRTYFPLIRDWGGRTDFGVTRTSQSCAPCCPSTIKRRPSARTS